MKKRSFISKILLISMVIFIASSAGITWYNKAYATPSDGPAAYWSFSEGSGTTVADLSGNGNTGTVSNETMWTAGGKTGSALVFNGSGAYDPASPTPVTYVDAGAGESLDISGSITVMAWIKSGSDWGTSNFPRIVDKMGTDSDGYALEIDKLNNKLDLSLPDGDIYSDAGMIATGKWQHVAATADGAVIKFYVNGAPAGTVESAFLPTHSDLALWIGDRSGTQGARTFNGTIDEVKIYPRALSALEIQEEFIANNTELPADPSELTVTSVVSAQNDLSWKDNADVETGYVVERKTGQLGTYSVIAASLPANTTSFKDTGIASSGAIYYYRVKAFNNVGSSGYSNEAYAVIHTSTTYYVSTTGNDTNAGTSAKTAWRTIAHAASLAQAGDTVNIKGGYYGHEHIVVAHSGTSSKLIIFQGYGDKPVILDGVDRTGTGIYVDQKQYVKISNISITRYFNGIFVDNSTEQDNIDNSRLVNNSKYVTLNNIYVYNCGAGHSDGTGIRMRYTDNSIIKNCKSTDAGGSGILVEFCRNNTVDNCKVYGIRKDDLRIDYYLDLAYVWNCTIKNCYAENKTGMGTKHGIGIKDYPNGPDSSKTYFAPHSCGNVISNCTSKNFEECFYVAEIGYNNEFRDCYGETNLSNPPYFSNVFMLRDGAHDNKFIRCTAKGVRNCVTVYDFEEDGVGDIQNGNIFENCIFQGGDRAIYLRNATNTLFKNCTFYNFTNLVLFEHNYDGADLNSGNKFRNCIISGVKHSFDTSNSWTDLDHMPYQYTDEKSAADTGYNDLSDVSFTYCDFHDNGFSPLPGTGNLHNDPKFANPKKGDFHLKSRAGRWTGSKWVKDGTDSPCIDAGNPADTYSSEPLPNGSRIDMGAYGNTREASKTYAGKGGKSN